MFMATHDLFVLALCVFSYACIIVSTPCLGQKPDPSVLHTYIIHVNPPPNTANSFDELETWYKSFLPPDRLIYSYSNVLLAGFAARLTEAELEEVSKKEGFMRAHPDQILQLHTTHSPSFLGLTRDVPGFWKDSNYGRGVIIGMVDGGVSPSHPSFNDKGMPPPPAKWKGRCEFNTTSSCNNKLVGARAFLRGMSAWTGMNLSYLGPYDYDGHGTHTASTAAGMFVEAANVNGLANGTASGIAPLAHLAVYKVCVNSSCTDSDILAAMDNAVHEGVDVLSVSIGGFPSSFYYDNVAIGALGAVEKGVFVACSAGNSGPYDASVENGAPWILTVGASSMDRSLRATVVLGSGSSTTSGESAYQPSNFSSASLPLVYPGLHGSYKAAFCRNGSLDDIDVRGKIVVCDQSNDRVVKAAGGAGMIVPNYNALQGYSILARANVLPTSYVSYLDGVVIKAFAISATAPTASIVFSGTLIGTTPAPAVAYFSSRGPNYVDPSILKPDIIGPGLNVLAAWPAELGQGYFNVISGTSMSAPHLSGVAALLKSAHPDWSPAAIKSAIMTTASLIANDGKPIVDESRSPASFLDIGAGHVDPSKATNPGLIYDIKFEDYINYLCGLNYTKNQLNATVRDDNVQCSGIQQALNGRDLNLPSFMVFLNESNSYTAVVKRKVTNVGAPDSSYSVKVSTSSSDQVKVDVSPKELSFSPATKTAEYSVMFTTSSKAAGKVYQGYLSWVSSSSSSSNGQNITVGSPMVMVVACGDQCLW